MSTPATLVNPRRKALFIRGLHDMESLIKIAKCEATKLGMTGTIIVVDTGRYICHLDGQAVIVEEVGCEYKTPGGGRKSMRDVCLTQPSFKIPLTR